MADTENASAPVEEVAQATEATTTNGSTESEAPAPNADESTTVKEATAEDADDAAEDIEQENKVNGATKRKASDKDDDQKTKRPRKDAGDRHRTAREQREEYNKNVKTDYSALEESSDPDEIRKQVEFYFSDSNLPLDTYLYNLVGGSDNKSVPVKVIHSFKRMKRYQPYSAVVEAIKESDVLDISGEAGKEEIRRKVALDGQGNKDDAYKAYEDKTMPRSIYIKGFGAEGASTQFDLEEFFAPYGPINSVRLRRSFPDKIFKGSVFVEFDSEETQKAFLELDPKPKFDGKELLVMSKKAYTDMKSEDIRQGKIKPNNERPGYNERYGNKGRGRGGRDRGGRDRDGRNGRDNRDRDDWKGRREDFQKGRGGRRGGHDDDDGVRKCYKCGEPGHRKNDCPQNELAARREAEAEAGGENGDKDGFGRDKRETKTEEVKEVAAEA